MNIPYRLQTLTIITLCIILFWAVFGLDIVLHPKELRFPLHRGFILMVLFIFIFNIQKAINIFQENKLLVSIVIYTLFSVAWAGNLSEALKDFTFFSTGLLITTLTASAFIDKKITMIRWLFWLYFLMTLASILVSIKYPQIGINVKDFAKPRWIGITSHPNGLGAEASILIWLSVNLLFLSKNIIEKPIVIFAMLSAFLVILKADSMTSLATSFIVIALTLYLYYLDRLNSTLKFFLLLSSILGTIIMFTFYMGLDDLIDVAFHSAGRNSNFSGRTRLWYLGFKAVSDHLLLGYGFDNLEALTKKYHLQMSHLHNGYIEFLLKGGIIGISLLFSVLIKTIIKLLRLKKTNKSDFIFLTTGFIMILLHNFTESSIFKGMDSLNIFLMYIIITCSLLSNSLKKPVVNDTVNQYYIKPLISHGK